MTIALVLAAGSGQRLGAGRPKALVELHGRSLMQWSLHALSRVPEIAQIVLALPAGVEHPPGVVSVRGGETRSESVKHALAAAGPAGELVLVHDAARPLLTPSLAETVIAALRESDAEAAIAAVPITDTIKRARDGVVMETLHRPELWAVQTPQVFRRDALERALAQPAEVLRRATDDAWLIEQAGGRVLVVPSSPENIKITTPLDLELAALILSRRQPD